jgi:AcrR family transcriptional regulator
VARTARAEAQAVRRETFVDVALRLIQTKGYERMSVQDVLDELDASKGAFYHYFDSKRALLLAVVERMTDVALAERAPVLEDPRLSALERLEALFTGIADWKAERKELVLSTIEAWASDDNAIVREKFRRSMAVRLLPPLAAIVRQGMDEGTFKAGSADDAARIFLTLLLGFQEVATDLFIARQTGAIGLDAVRDTVASFNDAFERILGAPRGSIDLADEAVLQEWFG